MKRFLLFITVSFSIIGCQGEGVNPSPDSFCIFQRSVSTNPSDIGEPYWIFLRCDPDPNYKINDYSRYTGYQTNDCQCSKTPK